MVPTCPFIRLLPATDYHDALLVTTRTPGAIPRYGPTLRTFDLLPYAGRLTTQFAGPRLPSVPLHVSPFTGYDIPHLFLPRYPVVDGLGCTCWVPLLTLGRTELRWR